MLHVVCGCVSGEFFQLFYVWKKVYFSLVLKVISAGFLQVQNSGLRAVVLTLVLQRYCFTVFSLLTSFVSHEICLPYLCPSVFNMSFSLAAVNIFSLLLILSNLITICFLHVSCAVVSVSSLDLKIFSCYHIGKTGGLYLFKYFLLSFGEYSQPNLRLLGFVI